MDSNILGGIEHYYEDYENRYWDRRTYLKQQSTQQFDWCFSQQQTGRSYWITIPREFQPKLLCQTNEAPTSQYSCKSKTRCPIRELSSFLFVGGRSCLIMSRSFKDWSNTFLTDLSPKKDNLRLEKMELVRVDLDVRQPTFFQEGPFRVLMMFLFCFSKHQ